MDSMNSQTKCNTLYWGCRNHCSTRRDMTVKKSGKTQFTGRIVVAADGKTRTVTISGTDKTGKPATTTSVYDKQ